MGSSVVEADGVYSVVMGVIVLQKSLRSAVENFDFLVGATRSKASAIWMELDAVDHTCVICEFLNLLLYLLALSDIPEPDSPIIGSRSDHPRVIRKLRALDPVHMTTE